MDGRHGGHAAGAVISPLLANIYLHYVYDLWVDQWRKRRATVEVIVIRYADDTVVGFRGMPMPSGSSATCGSGWRRSAWRCIPRRPA